MIERATLTTLLRSVSPVLLLLPITSVAQSLHLSSPSASPGQQVVIEISLKTSSTREPPSALQWEATIPHPQLSFLEQAAVAGPAAQTAGKSVNCAMKPKTGEAQTSLCILYGGQEPIHDGVIALLQLAIPPGARPGKVQVRLDHALAVSKNLIKVELAPAETHVRIRAK